MKVVILCGGKGIRLNNSLEFIPKGMVKVGHRPLLWHVMKIFAQHGHNEFILALGYGGQMIRDYFIHYDENVNDLTLTLGESNLEFTTKNQEENWKITFIETGEESGTGARLFRCQKYLNENDFFVTYADCLADVDINKLIGFHQSHGKIATATGVMPPFRYGEFMLENGVPIEFKHVARLKSTSGWVHGGFMIFKPKIFEYLTPFNECMIENETFKQLVKNKEINIFEHDGFWQCMDNERELEYLNNLCATNSEYWLY